jgi:glycosyltransferase involved in cell wall biosynthesis/GT2 family glycosyltransferase
VATVPHVSVLVAVSNGERYLRAALASIARQTVSDLELVVVDDGSTDSTPDVLAAFDDPRLRVVRNDERKGLAGALNRGLDEVRGRYVARMDADDLALPFWLERVVARIQAEPRVALVGAGILELRAGGRLGAAHLPEPGPAVTRWHALFSSSPFFHNTVVLDRELLDRHGLRYDESFGESEDYDLWTRVLAHAEADSLEELLVLYRVHPAQASQRRSALQRELGWRVARAQIAAAAPSLSEPEVELAWRFGFRQPLEAGEVEIGASAYLELVEQFAGSGRYSTKELERVRGIAAREFARRAGAAPTSVRAALLREALSLDPALAAHAVARRARRSTAVRRVRRDAEALVRADVRRAGAIRVAVVLPEPTPYRSPLLDRVAAHDEVGLTVIYAASSVVAERSWSIEHAHDAVYLRGRRLPGAERIFRHEYPVTPGVARALDRAQPDVVVVSGWSTFAAQGAISWCRIRGVPYVLLVESHDEGPRPGWRRTVKSAVVPRIVRAASGALVAGTLARESLLERGAAAERIHVFANTVDVEAFGDRARALAPRRDELRRDLGAGPEDVVVLSVARLGREKAQDILVRSVAEAGDPRVLLVLVGDGPERGSLERLAREAGIRVAFTGDRLWERIVESYVAADVFALVSWRETWGVVVNEAMACGLPLVLSDRVGAARDLLRDGENGLLVAAGDVAATADALRILAGDADERARMGTRSRELVGEWGYEPSVAGFVAAVRAAAGDPPR